MKPAACHLVTVGVLFFGLALPFEKLFAQAGEKEELVKLAAESYFRLGLQQAQEKREAYQQFCEATKKEFADAQSLGVKIIRPPVTSDGKPSFGTGIDPVNLKSVRGKRVAEFYKKEHRDEWVTRKFLAFEKRAERLKRIPMWEPPVLQMRSAEIGDCGYLFTEEEKDAGNRFNRADDELYCPEYERTPTPVEIIQVVNDSTIMATVDGVDCFIEGVQSKELSDGTRKSILSICYVHSTKQYVTVLGATRTLLLLKTVSDETQKKIFEYVKAHTPRAEKFGHFREWTDNKGEGLAFGMIVGKNDQQIVVVNENEKESKLEISSLSARDRQYLKDVSR